MCVRKIQCVCVPVCVLFSVLPLLPLFGVNQSFYYLIRRDTPTVESALCDLYRLIIQLQLNSAQPLLSAPSIFLGGWGGSLHLQPDANRCLSHAAFHYTTTIYGVSFT